MIRVFVRVALMLALLTGATGASADEDGAAIKGYWERRGGYSSN